MIYKTRLGRPEMVDFWNEITQKYKTNSLNKNDVQLFKKLVKTIHFLSTNPKHPGLKSHEITPLSKRYGIKVFQSYLENNKSSAGRIYWVYGPENNEITIIGLEPHPEDKKNGGYDKVKLSDC
jgi:hypothetical protein